MPKNEVQKRRGRLPSIEVVDLFCGIGGLSYGMKSEGFKILAGFDLDRTCQNSRGLFSVINSEYSERRATTIK